MGRRDVTVVEADGTALPSELDGFDRALVDAPCSGLGVLAQRPDLRWRAKPLPELQLALLCVGRRARAAGRDDRLLRLHAEPGRVRGGRRRERPDVSCRSARSGRQFAHPTRPEFLLTLPHVHGTSGFFVARLRRTIACMSWRDWVRDASRSSRRSTRPTSRASASRSRAPARRLPHLPLRRRRRPLRRAGHDRPGRARSRSRRSCTRGRRRSTAT